MLKNVNYKRGGSPVTEKELKKLNRAELLEMLIAQSKKLSRVEEELKTAQKELGRREIAITSSGTLAEAALKLSGIFENADKAAGQYLENLRHQEMKADRIVAEAQAKADGIVSEAQAKADGIVKAAEAQRRSVLAEAARRQGVESEVSAHK